MQRKSTYHTAFLMLVLLSVLSGCTSSLESSVPLTTMGTDTTSFLNTPKKRALARQSALDSIFNHPLTRDATAAIKRTGITMAWTNYPIPQHQTCFSAAANPCGYFIMLAKVNKDTQYAVELLIEQKIDGTFYAQPVDAEVVQTRRISSSKTIVSAADLRSKTSVWVDMKVGSGSLGVTSVNSNTVNLTANSRTPGYKNLATLLTVGGPSLQPSLCQASTLTVQCGGRNPTNPVTPAPPSTSPEPECDKNACASLRSSARSANWKIAGAVIGTAVETAAAASACAVAITSTPVIGPVPARVGCGVAAGYVGKEVSNAGATIIDANGDKDAYNRCKDRNPCVGYLREELLVLDDTATCKISLV